MITQERLKELFHYDQVSGWFTWRIKTNRRIVIGSRAGCVVKWGGVYYRAINIDGKMYSEHRLAFRIMENDVPEEVDHKDLNGTNNSWKNLRPATKSQNQANKRKYGNNVSGFKGARWNKKDRRWVAQISIRGKTTYLGAFDSVEEAAAAYEKKARELHGDFARVS